VLTVFSVYTTVGATVEQSSDKNTAGLVIFWYCITVDVNFCKANVVVAVAPLYPLR
jgi:hypothetical protein